MRGGLSRAAGVAFVGVVAAGLIAVRLEGRANHLPTAREAAQSLPSGCSTAARDYRDGRSDVWVAVTARVLRLLPDEQGRYQHQRFIVRCETGQTLLVVNDVSIGQRVPVSVGNRVGVRGEFVWNSQGGLIHFTHHDPGGGAGGWILLRGKLYG